MSDFNHQPVRSFEDLEAFQKAYQLSLEIHRATLGFPQIEQYALGDQMRRASKSVCANIAEGFGKQRHSVPDFRRFVYMAIGSSDEMKVWIKYGVDLGYFNPDDAARWRMEYANVARMLNGLVANWKNRVTTR